MVRDEITAAGPMTDARFIPIAVALEEGRVLVAGGLVPSNGNEDVALASAEVYDPSTNTFTAVDSMATGRAWPIVLPLPDGRIALIGDAFWTSDQGWGGEIFDPASNTFTATDGPGATDFRHGTALADGRALMVGGHCDEIHQMEGDGTSDTAKPVGVAVFDPARQTTSEAPAMPHCISNLVGLPDGRAFVSGFYYTRVLGANSDSLVTWSAIYDPTDGVVQLSQGPRGYLPSAIALADGRVLVWPGGYGWGDAGGMAPAWGDILE